ncbi:MAG TPA: PEP-CTERM sorting domain-containing protein [Rhodanobacteraceae bacterium]|nr:PEP-CTERM sorting domain-containing protein [Rhodanobacteraceae bacterium]
MAAAVVGLAGVVAAPLANATPISFYNDATVDPPDTLRFTLGCGSADGDCAGLLEALVDESPYTFDATALLGDLFELADSGDATEIAFVNTATGSSFSTSTKTQVGLENFEFSTSADYFLIKIGLTPNYALIHNTSGGAVDLFFTQIGQGAGLSHYTEFGGTVTVPEPAALGMFGLGALLIGLIAGLRRRYS